MVKNHPHARLGATAIAAVLALSSTPVSAQVADPLGPTAESVPAEPPVISAPTVTEPAMAPTVAPIVDEPAPAAEAKPMAKASKPKPVQTTAARQIAPRPTAAASSAPQNVEATAEVPTEAPVVTAEPVTPEVVPPAPVEAADATPMNSDLPLMAGGAGLAAIALLGTGIVASRRRRRRDEAAYSQAHVEQPVREPQFDRPVQAPVAAEERSAFAWGRQEAPAASANRAPAQKLPSGFDISKFGRHVQAAYRGPTPDNPSLSLKRRLKRASFFDMKERQANRGTLIGRAPELMPA